MHIFGRREEAAGRRLDAQRLEIAAGDSVAPYALRAAIVIERHHCNTVGEQRHENRIAVANVAIIGKRLRGTARIIDEKDARGIGERQWL